MSEEIPPCCDVIVIGTGLTESIVAAAVARVGKQITHLDYRDYYGSNWATFSFSSLPGSSDHSPEEIQGTTKLDTKELSLANASKCVCNLHEEWHCPERAPDSQSGIGNPAEGQAEGDPTTKCWTKEEIVKASRQFNLDLFPRVLFSRGDMVEVLISSGICRYAEFKIVSNIYTFDHGESRLMAVPCSRADVFNSKDITMIEKRLLMKTLTACVDFEKKPEDFIDFESKTFGEFLTAQKIHGKIRRYVMDTLAMATEETDFRTAISNVKKFVGSIGRYGNSPFLWTLYGSGELPQCFCRCSAVFGGLYCLKRHTSTILIGDQGLAVGVTSENQCLKSSFVVVEDSLTPQASVKSRMSRAILITDRSLVGVEQSITQITFPSADGTGDAVRILELSFAASACPRGLFVVHLTTRQITTAVEDLKAVINILFGQRETDPKILWSLHFEMQEFENAPNSLPSNVYSCAGPSANLDLDDYVKQAKTIFHSMFPDEEFLPRVPDPEDIVFEDPSSEGVEPTEEPA